MARDDSRFDRQIRFAPLGAAGQDRLGRARVLLVGCGATGGSVAQNLVRCGVGTLVLVDRDVVEESNLARQVLFEARHLGRPKAEAAREALLGIGGPSRIETHVEHVDADNLEALAKGADLLLDGTDNLTARYLMNDFAVARGLPWIYAGVVGSSGLVLPVLPGRGACLRCLFPQPAPPTALDTCETAGVILPAVALVASLEAGAALRWLASDQTARENFVPGLFMVDVWTGELRRLNAPRDPQCPCCHQRSFPFLQGDATDSAVALCGRPVVQIRPAGRRQLDLESLGRTAGRFARRVRLGEGLLEFQVDEARFLVFPDGRALIEGTDDTARARALYDRYVGS
jgi:adenylyltransferase/sulfurtransferase